ncbi:MAG: hypothetical protein IPP12_17900 [Nitrospira sp.]|nr:hypothetical protein [Nitrospira sp.]
MIATVVEPIRYFCVPDPLLLRDAFDDPFAHLDHQLLLFRDRDRLGREIKKKIEMIITSHQRASTPGQRTEGDIQVLVCLVQEIKQDFRHVNA